MRPIQTRFRCVLSSERVSFTYGDKPVELRRGLYLTSRHHYQNELS